MKRGAELVEAWYPEKRFGGFTHVDGTVAFYARVNAVVEPSSVVLDVGCGRGAARDDPIPWRRALQIFRGRCSRVIGVDVDPAGATNPLVDEFHLMEHGRIPLDAATVDVCYADTVLEHVEDVELFFSECARVIRPGGYLFVRTPNVWSYLGVASRLVPDRLHRRVLARLQPERRAEDVFPTLYRCNSRRKLRRALDSHGFYGVVQTHEAEPGYLSFSSLLYRLGVLYQRHAPPAIRGMLHAYAVRRHEDVPSPGPAKEGAVGRRRR